MSNSTIYSNLQSTHTCSSYFSILKSRLVGVRSSSTAAPLLPLMMPNPVCYQTEIMKSHAECFSKESFGDSAGHQELYRTGRREAWGTKHQLGWYLFPFNSILRATSLESHSLHTLTTNSTKCSNKRFNLHDKNKVENAIHYLCNKRGKCLLWPVS